MSLSIADGSAHRTGAGQLGAGGREQPPRPLIFRFARRQLYPFPPLGRFSGASLHRLAFLVVRFVAHPHIRTRLLWAPRSTRPVSAFIAYQCSPGVTPRCGGYGIAPGAEKPSRKLAARLPVDRRPKVSLPASSSFLPLHSTLSICLQWIPACPGLVVF